MVTNVEVEPPARAATRLYDEALVWDNVFPVNLPGEVAFGNTWDELDRFAKAGVNVVSITLAGDNHNASQALNLCAWARRELRDRSTALQPIHSVQDVEIARATGKLGVVLHFEGTRCFERNLDLVELFYALGIRQTLLAFNNQNCAGGGCADAADTGLTGFGRRLVAELERVGMLLDLSHTGYRTSLDALEIATRPAVFSHSNAYALCPSFRNLKDEQMLACARTGGLIGISGASEYLGDIACATQTIFKHLDYVAQRVGIDHVGLGQDVVFEPESLTRWARGRPEEWPMTRATGWPGFRYAVPEQLPQLAQTMLRHGYTEPDVRKVLGDNILRVCREVWR
jgi:membrane dipeptidase